MWFWHYPFFYVLFYSRSLSQQVWNLPQFRFKPIFEDFTLFASTSGLSFSAWVARKAKSPRARAFSSSYPAQIGEVANNFFSIYLKMCQPFFWFLCKKMVRKFFIFKILSIFGIFIPNFLKKSHGIGNCFRWMRFSTNTPLVYRIKLVPFKSHRMY